MAPDSEPNGDRRFACTQCSACCNRSPEVLLSEAAGLSDLFVFRLMFRLYELPRTLAGHLASEGPAGGSAEAFYETKRLLAAFSVGKHISKRRQNGRCFEYSTYLTISALSLDTDSGRCTALAGGRCGIYDRRPLACRTVPFHYSRPEASAPKQLSAFVESPGYACDTSVEAPLVLEAGRLVDSRSLQARQDALDLAARDRPWAQAILKRVRNGSRSYGLPSLPEIEANAAFGATTTSMRGGWRIGVEAGLVGPDAYSRLIATQAEVIDRELRTVRCAPAARQTLVDMRAEYRQAMNEPGLGAGGKADVRGPWTGEVRW